MSNKFWIACQNFWEKNGRNVLVLLALLLVSLASFQAGRTSEKNRQTSQIKVSLTRGESSNPQKEKQQLLEKVAGTSLKGQSEGVGLNTTTKEGEGDCRYIASKNSNKYHLPNCRYAANIKQENKKCFSSGEEAEKAGYTGGSCCVNKK